MSIVTIGTYEFDAYVDVAFADQFLAGDAMRGPRWAPLNADAKGRGIVSATRAVVALDWCAGVAPDLAAPPVVVQHVTALLAADIAAKPSLIADATGNSNIKRAKAGSAEVEFFNSVKGGPPLPLPLWNMLIADGLIGCGLADIEAAAGAITTGTGECSRFRGSYGYPGGYDARDRPFGWNW